ncbi:hypothetical protein [Leuconostoc mesenteroides]|uniref:Wzy n=1 Tax=Leuconostoc mesenteroides TaxID=1245 RepID=A0A7S6VFS3_LEUME|nr:hypothetical protein [Leuconostoc mesenteroides]QOW37920.1 Wzy [Leuconostoc mesenteroides]
MQKNEKKKPIENRNDVYAFVMFYMIVLLQTMLFTSFGRFYPSAAQIFGKLEIWLILFYLLYALMIKITLRKIIYAIVVLLIVGISQFYAGTSTPFIKLLMLTIAVPRTILSANKIAKIFGYAMLTTMCITIFLSLLGYLPKSGETSRVLFAKYQETVYFYGFTHPNIFGAFLTTLFMIYYFLFYKTHKIYIIFAAIVLLIIDISIAAGTAAIGILMVLVFTFIHGHKDMRIQHIKLLKLSYLIPAVLTFFCFWLANNNNGSLGVFINEKIASRPNIWNAYITQYPIHFVNRLPEIQIDGINTILGNGALDGGYIYALIYWGILSWLTYYFIFNSIIKFSLENDDFSLYCVALVTMIMTFPESHMIMFFENVFLIFVGFYQYPKNERILYFRNKI